MFSGISTTPLSLQQPENTDEPNEISSDGNTGGIDYDQSNTEAEKVFRILSSGSHTHTISGAPSVSVSVSNANTGGGGAHENRPPYYALCYIMRIS